MHERRRPPALPAYEIRRLSVIAECDPRTVRRVLDGAPTRNIARARVERALRAAGHEVPRG